MFHRVGTRCVSSPPRRERGLPLEQACVWLHSCVTSNSFSSVPGWTEKKHYLRGKPWPFLMWMYLLVSLCYLSVVSSVRQRYLLSDSAKHFNILWQERDFLVWAGGLALEFWPLAFPFLIRLAKPGFDLSLPVGTPKQQHRSATGRSQGHLGGINLLAQGQRPSKWHGLTSYLEQKKKEKDIVIKFSAYKGKDRYRKLTRSV